MTYSALAIKRRNPQSQTLPWGKDSVHHDVEFRPLTHILRSAEENIIEKKLYCLLSPDMLSRFSA
jgi:hypothetical protein